MPRVRQIESDGGDVAVQEMFAKEREAFGSLLNTTKVLAHCPPILKAAKELSAAVERSGLVDPQLRALVYLRVALINGCPFWIDINASRGMQHGATVEKVQDVPQFKESPLFVERERVALEFAERMTITGEEVDDELFSRVRRHFSEAETVELAAAVALENFRSKFNVALGIEAQGFCLIK